MEREDIEETFGARVRIWEAVPQISPHLPNYYCGSHCILLKSDTGCEDHTQIYLGITRSPAECAKRVKKNRMGFRHHCSMYFMAGGTYGACHCLHAAEGMYAEEAGDFECEATYTYDGSSLFVVPSPRSYSPYHHGQQGPLSHRTYSIFIGSAFSFFFAFGVTFLITILLWKYWRRKADLKDIRSDSLKDPLFDAMNGFPVFE